MSVQLFTNLNYTELMRILWFSKLDSRVSDCEPRNNPGGEASVLSPEKYAREPRRPGGPRAFFLLGLRLLLLLGMSDWLFSQPTLPFSEVVTIAGVEDLYPYSYQDNGRITGFFPELLRAAAQELVFSPEFIPVTWQQGLELVQRGGVDIMVSLTRTEERERYIDYNNIALATSWGMVLVPRDSRIADLLSLDGQRVGIVAGDQNGQNLQNLTQSFGIRPQFIPFDSHGELEQGIVDGRVAAGAFFSAYPFDEENIRRSPIIYSPVETFIGVPKNRNLRLLVELDDLFTRWIDRSDSPYYQIQEQFITNQGRRSGSVFPSWVLPVLILFALGFLIVLGLNLLLRRLIHRKTKELQTSNELLMAIFNNAPMPIVMTDREGDLRYVNERFTQMLGYTTEDIPTIEDWWRTFYPEVDRRERARQAYQRRLEHAISQKQTTIEPVEATLVSREGQSYIFRFLVTLTEDLDVVMLQDLTELRANQMYLEDFNAQLERLVNDRTQELEQSRQALFLSEKNAGLGRMVAGFSHEVNTPIGVGLTAASFLLEETQRFAKESVSGQVSRSGFESYLEQAQSSSQIILQNLERAASLINGFKQVSTDQMHLSIRIVNLADYLRQVMMSLQPRFRNTRHTWKIDCPELPVETYPGALAQIITNLVTNSLTYAFPSPELIGIIRITASHDDHRVFIRFEDNGVGIPMEDWTKVFEPFFTTGRGRGGTGLGLNIVHTLVTERLEGTIGIRRSELGGACFMIDIPIHLSPKSE